MQKEIQDRAAAISFRQLKLFESIGRLKSVRRASEECNLSQPAVTQALAKLEQQVGATLVDRRASGSYLNALGDLFYARVQRFFDQIEQALTEAGAPSGHNTAKLISKRLSRSQVRALVAIVETGSFAQAAGSLALSQSSLQRAARDLEGNIRKEVFYRTAAGMMVTPAGAELGRRMKLASQEIEWGIRELEAAQGECSSQIVIGAMPFGGSVLLASVLDEFVAAHPQVDVRISNENASEMLKKLRAGDVDFVVGLLPGTVAEDLTSEPLAETPYSVVGRRGHPLARKGRIEVEDLRRYEWVVGNPGASRRACFEQLFADGALPRAPIATCAVSVIRQLLSQSDRLTLMTNYELLHEGDVLSEVDFGPISTAPTIGITMRADWMPTCLHQDLMDIVRRHTATATTRRQLKRAG